MWLDMERNSTPAQLVLTGVDLETPEKVTHGYWLMARIVAQLSRDHAIDLFSCLPSGTGRNSFSGSGPFVSRGRRGAGLRAGPLSETTRKAG